MLGPFSHLKINISLPAKLRVGSLHREKVVPEQIEKAPKKKFQLFPMVLQLVVLISPTILLFLQKSKKLFTEQPAISKKIEKAAET